MKRLTWALVCLACFHTAGASALPQDAEHKTGNFLLRACQAAIKSAEPAHNPLTVNEWNDAFSCMGYVDGATDAYRMQEQMRHNAIICIPSETTVGQLVRVLVKYLDAHPEELHEAKSYLTTMAFAQAFPCSRKPEYH